MSRDRLLSDVRAAVREELEWHKVQAPDAVPLPSDLSAEQGVLSAILGGLRKPSKLAPLEAADFFDPLNRQVYLAAKASEEAGSPISATRCLQLMQLQGMRVTDSACEDVAWLEVNAPLEAAETLRDTVLEMARRRRMIAWLQSLELDLRLGKESVAGTKSRIGEALARSSRTPTSPPRLASVKKPLAG